MDYDTMPDDPDAVTLEEAKRWLRERVREGARCPCCTQIAKVYKRKLSSGMAYALCLIYRYFQLPWHEEWCDITDYLLSSHRVSAANSNAALLRYWGLLEAMVGEREDGSTRVGLYKLTALGKLFVENKASVPKYIYLYEGRLLPNYAREAEEAGGVPDGNTSIHDALGDKFDYDELMKA